MPKISNKYTATHWDTTIKLGVSYSPTDATYTYTPTGAISIPKNRNAQDVSWGWGDTSFDHYDKYGSEPTKDLKEIKKESSSPEEEVIISSSQLEKYQSLENKLYDQKDQFYKIQDDKIKVEKELYEAREEIKKLNTQVRALMKRL